MKGAGHIQLGGRAFSIVNYDAINVLNEHYVMKFMRETGLDSAVPKATGESDDEYLLRLQGRLVDTLRLPELLAGYLLPLGKTEADWSLAMAADTAKFIGALSSAEDRAEVHRLGMSIVFDFFRAGLDSFKTLESFLNGAGPEQRNENQPTTSRNAAH